MAFERLEVVDLSAAKSLTVLVESILSQRFGQGVGDLIVGADGKMLNIAHTLVTMNCT
jgi:hypothetical protein